MWQHAANIVLGLLLIAVSFIASALDYLSSGLLWVFVSIGAVNSALAFWGFLDEVRYETAKQNDS